MPRPSAAASPYQGLLASTVVPMYFPAVVNTTLANHNRLLASKCQPASVLVKPRVIQQNPGQRDGHHADEHDRQDQGRNRADPAHDHRRDPDADPRGAHAGSRRGCVLVSRFPAIDP